MSKRSNSQKKMSIFILCMVNWLILSLGSVPKDGPSAGTAICTALLSLSLNKKIPGNVAMTGEISLNGEVCKIGKKGIFIIKVGFSKKLLPLSV